MSRLTPAMPAATRGQRNQPLCYRPRWDKQVPPNECHDWAHCVTASEIAMAGLSPAQRAKLALRQELFWTRKHEEMKKVKLQLILHAITVYV